MGQLDLDPVTIELGLVKHRGRRSPKSMDGCTVVVSHAVKRKQQRIFGYHP